MMCNKLLKSRARLWADKSGNVAIITALSLLPILLVFGLSIDFQLVVTKKARVQRSLDATLLATARERQAGLTDADAAIFAQREFVTSVRANERTLDCTDLGVSFASDDQTMNASVTCTHKTIFGGILGRDELDFVVHSSTVYGLGQVDVSFVFDLSGSMNQGGRLRALKEAANQAVETLLPEGNASGEQEVRIAIATYNHSVNAGDFYEDVVEINRRPARLEAADEIGEIYEDEILGVAQVDRSNDRRFYDFETALCTRSNRRGVCRRFTRHSARFFSENTCVYNRLGDEEFTDAGPDDDAYIFGAHPLWEHATGASDRDRSVYEEIQTAQQEVIDQDGQYRDGRNGSNPRIINARDRDRRVRSSGPFTYGILFNGRVNDAGPITTCPESEPVPLTNNRQELVDYIGDMEAEGGTAGHLGIAWGWYLLSPEWSDVWPSDASPLEYDEEDSTKVLIIMTDGIFNSRNPASEMNSNEMAAAYCDNIKEDTDITIFTIGFEVPSGAPKIGSSGKTITEYCASSEDFAFDASGAEELADAYASITASISDLRISQ